ncbi:MAG TPA: helix-turn-helix domain-containing protein [Verrucomicrobiae bacterium]|jgi:AraC-like DNA-binding protein|nr:helix-turn-helix domain-containing protein [Verrucomicrobiae bacterium]
MQTTLVGRETETWADAAGEYGDTNLNEGWRPAEAPRSSYPDATRPFPVIGVRNSENHALVEAMVNSRIYQDYEKAFSDATGLPVELRPVESRLLPNTGNTAVPVRLGDRLIGFLQTGSVEGNQGKQHDGVVKLLAIFAQHLSLLSNQVVVQQENSEPPAIMRAKEFIHQHQTEDLSLGQVAKAVNMSTFYFCKMFKKVTGINFTDYLSRVRIEKSKNLLLNPNLRVSEIAFEVGFQSLTHFNRVFKRILGQSPTEYRAQLLAN